MAADQEDEIVRIATALNPEQAYIWRDALEAEGIKCRVVGDYLDAGIGDISGLSPEIWVHRADVERATRVLNDDAG
ncbi:MAG TPA: DUF2007 domain-containing protein [Gemmataceae bacterium]|nr:DUF2007 domain-containing protein [Gemmataceae bacterium]